MSDMRDNKLWLGVVMMRTKPGREVEPLGLGKLPSNQPTNSQSHHTTMPNQPIWSAFQTFVVLKFSNLSHGKIGFVFKTAMISGTWKKGNV